MMSLVCGLKLCQNKFITQYTIKESTKSVDQYHWAFEELRGNHGQKAVFINTASVSRQVWPLEGGEDWVRVTQT